MTTLHLDQNRIDSFAQQTLERLNGAAVLLMTSIGHRTGLFDTMANLAPSTSAEIAARAGLNERYVREWLGAMVTGGVVDFERGTGRYRLPSEHAACLTRAASPNNLAAITQWLAVLGTVEDQVVDAFVRGNGVPYEAYARFHAVMAEDSGQNVVAALDEHILPLVDDLRVRLEGGIDVLDIGCGSGLALIHLAKRFPASRFTGWDIGDEPIRVAEAEARRAGLENVRFEVRDVAELRDESRWHLITAFDAIHDQARPEVVLRSIRAALRPRGVFLMQEIKASSDLHENVEHPAGSFLYTISCMHCMSVSLARGGSGLGACWGHQTAARMLQEAGFSRFERRELPHDPMNDYWVVRP